MTVAEIRQRHENDDYTLRTSLSCTVAEDVDLEQLFDDRKFLLDYIEEIENQKCQHVSEQ